MLDKLDLPAMRGRWEGGTLTSRSYVVDITARGMRALAGLGMPSKEMSQATLPYAGGAFLSRARRDGARVGTRRRALA